MKNSLICALFLIGIFCLSSAVADNDEDTCEKTKTLTITLPQDPTKAPEADPDELCVEKNGNVNVVLDAAGNDASVKIVFLNGKTPLGNGNNKEKIKKDGKKLKIRNNCGGCKFEYKVYDTTPGSTRPVLDPVIIIER